MSFDLKTLYNLLPAVYRIRDLQQLTGDTSLLGQGTFSDVDPNTMPLYALMNVLAEQIGVLEENLAQLYDDQFIETCAQWVIPYIGDLVGYQLPHASSVSLRSEVANTIRYRKRKGTVTLLEKLTRDVTGWDTHVVEYFSLLATTQNVLRPRPESRLIDLRQLAVPSDAYPPSPFETLPHPVEVRNIATGGGRYNLANVGIFLWRLSDYSLTDIQMVPARIGDANRYLYYFNPLGSDMQLFTRPHYDENATQLAGPLAVAAPITRLMLQRAFSDYYGRDKSFWLTLADENGNTLDIVPDPIQTLIDLSQALSDALQSGRLDFQQLTALSEALYNGITAQRGIPYHQLADPINHSATLSNAFKAVEQLDFQQLATLTALSGQIIQELQNLPRDQQPGTIYYPIIVADLGDETAEDEGERVRWKSSPDGVIAIDPELGRLAFPKQRQEQQRRPGQRKRIDRPADFRVTFSYGFSADMGGGEYHRSDSFALQTNIQQVGSQLTDVQAALDKLAASGTDGVVEITDSDRMEGLLKINPALNQRIELRAADYCRPLLELRAGRGRRPRLEITGADGAEVTLNGLVITDGELFVNGPLHRLALNHCTLIPTRQSRRPGFQREEEPPGLLCESNDTVIEIDHTIIGRLDIKDSAQVAISNSIVDAGLGNRPAGVSRESRLAYAGPLSFTREDAALDTLTIVNSTIIGRVHTATLNLASNTIFYAHQDEDGPPPLLVERRQEGCARFSYVPRESQAPLRRYHCRPKSGDDLNVIVPQFTSLRYGSAGYCQLSMRTSDAIRVGADDKAEMGAFHDLFQPQRTDNLNLRLQEYLRFGFETGIFFMT